MSGPSRDSAAVTIARQGRLKVIVEDANGNSASEMRNVRLKR